MNQHRLPDASSEYLKQRQAIARITDAYGGLPRLFAVPLDTDHLAGTVAAWGIEFLDGSALTCNPAGSAYGTWGSSIAAAALLGTAAGRSTSPVPTADLSGVVGHGVLVRP